MADTAVLAPVAAMLLLTLVVWLYMYARRLSYIARAGIDPETLKSPVAALKQLPAEVSYPADNLRNLCELPVLFYTVCVALYVTGAADTALVVAAWLFAGLRALHSVVHCTFNNVRLRFLFYMLSALALWFMVLRFAAGVLA